MNLNTVASCLPAIGIPLFFYNLNAAFHVEKTTIRSYEANINSFQPFKSQIDSVQNKNAGAKANQLRILNLGKSIERQQTALNENVQVAKKTGDEQLIQKIEVDVEQLKKDVEELRKLNQHIHDHIKNANEEIVEIDSNVDEKSENLTVIKKQQINVINRVKFSIQCFMCSKLLTLAILITGLALNIFTGGIPIIAGCVFSLILGAVSLCYLDALRHKIPRVRTD